MGEDGVDVLALWALDIHEKGLWGLDELLEFMLNLFLGWVNVKKIDFHCFLSNKVLIYLIIINHP